MSEFDRYIDKTKVINEGQSEGPGTSTKKEEIAKSIIALVGKSNFETGGTESDRTELVGKVVALINKCGKAGE